MPDISGKKFHRLTVIGRAHGLYWNCECECGKKTKVKSDQLTGGRTRSCGCLKIEAASRTGQKNKVHGKAIGRRAGVSASPEYTAWASMKTRCFNSNIRNWHRYGGRGISVCPEWMDDFEVFLNNIGPRPSPLYSVDRYPNPDGDYEPGNVRWATAEQQQNNKSKKAAA